MNKKDVETIGYLMAARMSREEFEQGMFKLDPRIKDEMELQEEITGRDEATAKRFDELMTEEYGGNWCMLKKELKPDQKKIWQQAYNEIRGITDE